MTTSNVNVRCGMTVRQIRVKSGTRKRRRNIWTGSDRLVSEPIQPGLQPIRPNEMRESESDQYHLLQHHHPIRPESDRSSRARPTVPNPTLQESGKERAIHVRVHQSLVTEAGRRCHYMNRGVISSIGQRHGNTLF